MSGLQTECSCRGTHCLNGNCGCFKAKLFCSLTGCSCIGCQNIESNEAEVDSKYKAYLKRKGPDVDDKYLIVPPGGFPAPKGVTGCQCKKTKCLRRCGCRTRFARCTSTCTCQDCANSEGIRGSDTNIEGAQVDDNSSRAKEPAQMQEQLTQAGDESGSGQNKRAKHV